jgi:hypothetical protein
LVQRFASAIYSRKYIKWANTLWRQVNTKLDGHGKFLCYSSEDDIAYFVRRFLEDTTLIALEDFDADRLRCVWLRPRHVPQHVF